MSANQFNTLYADLDCPFCKEKVISGVGFRLGYLGHQSYHLDDTLNWDGQPINPSRRPEKGNIIQVGCFNCDNVRCASWQDCYPTVQQAFVHVANNVLVACEPVDANLQLKDFQILEVE